MTRSQALFKEALDCLVGGVNSPVRAFRAVGGDPIIFKRGTGSRLIDVDGNEYLDMVSSWGPMLLGQTDPEVLSAVKEQLENGFGFGATSELEIRLAELIVKQFDSIEKVRFVNSGTEATMSAVRLARGVTGRNKIIKFAGCYHGHYDGFLIKAGSGGLTLGVPDSAGISKAMAEDTIIVEYNDIAGVEQAVKRFGEDVAALIVEPVAGNMGVVPPIKGFLEGLRRITGANGILLIFDEIITAFRIDPKGAQYKYGIKPDITCLGKIIGGGFPVGAYGASKAIMDHLAPLGSVYQAGTLSGNPVSMAAGLATLKKLLRPEIKRRLADNSERFATGMGRIIERLGLTEKMTVNQVGPMFTTFFGPGPINNLCDTAKADTARYRVFFGEMLKRSVYLPPSAFEANFVSAAQDDNDIAHFLAAYEAALKVVFKL